MAYSTLKKAINYLRILNILKKETAVYPELLDKPQGAAVLVLSPHPDDDVVGCGGTLCKHHLSGNEITIIYLTDGRKGDPTFTNEQGLVKERQKEAREAAKIIGIDNLVFLNHRDLKLRKSEETAGEMIELLDKIKPDIIYLPFFLDNHPDHIATNEIFVAACKNMECKFECYAYEIWTPLMPNRVVDISEHIEKKIDAIKQHKTQLKHINYVAKIKGLNAYRSITVPNARHVEAFFSCKPQEYIKLFKMK